MPGIIDSPGGLNSSEWKIILRELCLVNRWLGGLPAALQEIQSQVQRLSEEKHGSRQIRIVDLGSGSADIPLALVAWAKRKGYSLQVLAVDLSSAVYKIAQHNTRHCPKSLFFRAMHNSRFGKRTAVPLLFAPPSCITSLIKESPSS